MCRTCKKRIFVLFETNRPRMYPRLFILCLNILVLMLSEDAGCTGETLRPNIGTILNSFCNADKKLIRRIESLEKKGINHFYAVIFNEKCTKENLLPTFTNIYIYIHCSLNTIAALLLITFLERLSMFLMRRLLSMVWRDRIEPKLSISKMFWMNKTVFILQRFVILLTSSGHYKHSIHNSDHP